MALKGKIAAKEFDLALTLTCGQVFGWHHQQGIYYGMINDAAVGLKQIGSKVEFEASDSIEPESIVAYLGLDEDLHAILAEIKVDDFMRKVTRKVRNLRLLRQDPWACLCAYIISANNRVERIDAIYKRLAQSFGKPRTVGSYRLFAFPRPQTLARCSESDLRACGTGFRAPYLLEAARMISGGLIDLAQPRRLPYEEARHLLKTIPGVGDKVADCVLLFAYSRYEAFPIDVWIKRAIEKVYFGSKTISMRELRQFGRDYFGRYAGYAQEYIYHYARLYGV